MVATWAEWKAPVSSWAPELISRSASARATSTFVWLSPSRSSSFAPPMDLMPPAALTASAASCAPSRQSCPTSAMAPVTGLTTPILTVRGWARSGRGPAATPAPTSVVLTNIRRVTRVGFIGVLRPWSPPQNPLASVPGPR